MELHVKGAQLSYQVAGGGQPLVLVHGAGDNQEAWWGQVPAFAQRCRVITYDVRGHG